MQASAAAEIIVQIAAAQGAPLVDAATAPPPRGLTAERLAAVAVAREAATERDEPIVIFGTLSILAPFFDLLGIEV